MWRSVGIPQKQLAGSQPPAIRSLARMRSTLRMSSLAAVLFWSPSAWASDPSGLASVLAIAVIGVPFLIGSTIATIAGALKEKYASRDHAVNHLVISSFFLALGTFAFLVGLFSEHGGAHVREALLAGLVLLGIPAFFMLVPWLLHRWQRKER